MADISGTHSVQDLCADTLPTIVSLSDVHGHRSAAISALRTLTDRAGYDPIVRTTGKDGISWAGNDYVLVWNGDLIDRGPANLETLELVSALLASAPPGRVRVTLGNHEAMLLTPSRFGFHEWFSNDPPPPVRRCFIRSILSGDIVAAYEGHSVVYCHAGTTKPLDVQQVNKSLRVAARRLYAAQGSPSAGHVERAVVRDHGRILHPGTVSFKDSESGIAWIDLAHLDETAPPQIVGHTRQDHPIVQHDVICQDVILNNVDSVGGEGVIVESPTSILALTRCSDGSVTSTPLG